MFKPEKLAWVSWLMPCLASLLTVLVGEWLLKGARAEEAHSVTSVPEKDRMSP